MPEINKNPEDRNAFVDELLDASLARYAQAEVRPGLERRIEAALQTAPAPAAFPWRWLPLAAAAVFLIAAGLYFLRGHEPRVPEVAEHPKAAVAPMVTAPQGTQRAAASAPIVNPTAVKQPVASHALVAAASASSRREQFPSPIALSEQEQLLVRFVNQSSPKELQALARQNRAEPIKDLHVDALEIPPVVVGETDSE
jgi:hypothetical protein